MLFDITPALHRCVLGKGSPQGLQRYLAMLREPRLIGTGLGPGPKLEGSGCGSWDCSASEPGGLVCQGPLHPWHLGCQKGHLYGPGHLSFSCSSQQENGHKLPSTREDLV